MDGTDLPEPRFFFFFEGTFLLGGDFFFILSFSVLFSSRGPPRLRPFVGFRPSLLSRPEIITDSPLKQRKRVFSKFQRRIGDVAPEKNL